MGERQNLSSSYVFRPILEPPDHQQHQLQVASSGCHQFSSDRLSVNSCGGSGGTVRKRVNSGGPSPLAANLDVSRPTPKLSSCWRATGGGSQDAAWSSQGSRHSSRPGSTTSSRPSSQCCNAPVVVSSSAAIPPGSLLYSKSNNSSTSDVSVSKNFQQLTVSTRRAAFRAQKWSHSLDQPCVSSAHTSPGRRRQTSLQQKSLDLDSGYRSSTSDLKSAASHSQSSWNNDIAGGMACRHPTALAAGGGGGGGGGGVCSPISDARQELRELKCELESAAAGAAGAAATAAAAAPATDTSSSKEDFISRSASMPTFCCGDGCGGGDPQHAKTAGGLKQKMLDASSHHLSVLESVTNLDLADDLDEEIKMIVAQGGVSTPGSTDSGGQRCTRRERSPYFQPDMHEVLSLLDDDDAAAAANHCPLMPRGREGLERGGRRFALGLRHENDDAPASGDIVLIVPPHVRRPEPTKQQDHGDGDCVAKQLDFFAGAAVTVPSGSSDVVLSSNLSQRPPEEQDLLLAKAEHVEDEAAAAAGPAKPPLPSQPTTSRRSRLVRSQRIAEVKEEKDDSQPQAHAPKSGRTGRCLAWLVPRPSMLESKIS